MRSRFGFGLRPADSSRGRAASVRAWIVLGAAAALTLSALAAAGAAAAQPALARQDVGYGRATAQARATARIAASGKPDYRRACAVTSRAGRAACMALIRTNVPQRPAATAKPGATVQPGTGPAGAGYGPASLQSAYKLPSATAGAGQTVAIVDAYDDPDAAANLATYRAAWGLPACGTGCFRKINENGQANPLPSPARSTGWATEESLDLDMVSAACPNCHILLVEASSPNISDLGTAVNTAVGKGAVAVSNSYGGRESAADPGFDASYYQHTGVAITASAGDSGYGVSYPAASQDVTSVGGTSLTTAANARRWTETVWGANSGGEGTGSGCSAYDAKPRWQTDTGCARRTDNDVAAVANPNTGVAVYDSYDERGWLEVGGTSAASPLIASVFALAGTPAKGSYPSSYLYVHTSGLYDVTSGANGRCGGSYLCTARAGYDGPAGWGTPDGTAAFGSGASPRETVQVTQPGSQTSTVGTAASLQIRATDSGPSGQLTYGATGLPAGLSISPGSGKITGTPTTAKAYHVTVTARDGGTATGSASFAWMISSPAGTSCAAGQLLRNPGFETGQARPWTSSPDVIKRGSAAVPARSGSWLAWLDGYGAAHTDTLAQTVTIPPGCRAARLSFWLKITSTDPAGRAADTLKVQVLGPGGNPATTLATYSNRNSTGRYVRRVLSLSSYIGQTVTLKFIGTETVTGQDTGFFEDSNALTVS